MVQPSTSDHSNTGTSQSQMSGAENPQAVSQKSSVYLSIAGDITGSITRLRNKSALSPEPRLYGTRRRSRVPQPVCKTSTKKVVSSPIPEDHKESAEHEEEDLLPSSQSDNPEDVEIPPTQLVVKKGSSKQQKTNPALAKLQQNAQVNSDPSQNSSSEMGMFVSLASQTQTRLSTTLVAASSSDFEDVFQIVDESKVYRAPVGHPKSVRAQSEKSKDRGKKKAESKKGSSSEEAGNCSPEEDKTQHRETNISAGDKKITKRSLSFDEADGRQSPGDALAKVKKKKARKDASNVKENQPGTAEAEDADMESLEKRSGSKEREKSISKKKGQRNVKENHPETAEAEDVDTGSMDKRSGNKEREKSISKKKGQRNVKENHSEAAEAEDVDTCSMDKRSGRKEREKSISKKKGQRNVKENHPEAAEAEDVDTGSMDKRSRSKETEKSISKKKGQRNVKENHPETAEVEDVETGSMDKRGGSKEREKSISKKKGQGSGMESQDSEEERPVMTKKIKKGKGNMFSDVNKTVPSAASRRKSPTSKEKQTRKALEKPSSAFDVDDDHDKSPPVEPETQHQKAAVKNKSKRSSSKLAEQGTSEENTTEEEPLVPESAANSESSVDHRRVQKTKKSRSKNIAEEEHLAQETASVNRSSTQHSPARKTRTQAKQDRQAIPVEQEQKRRKRGKRSTKSEAELSNLEEKVNSVKPSKRGKKGLGDSAHGVSPAKKVRRASTAVDQEDAESLEENEGENYTPGGQTLADMSIGDSALKSGISFRRFTHVPSSLKTGRSRQLTYSTSEAPEEDIISSPAFATLPRQSSGASLNSSRPQPTPDSTPVGGYLHRKVNEDSARRKKERRVTICDNVTFRSFSPEEKGEDNSMLPSMSATPVHYYQLTAPTSAPEMAWKKNKIVHPDDNTAGLRRSQRTRVKPLEWYKNERIIYDRRDSGPVIMGVEPSREHIYMEQENQRRRKRRQKYLVSKKQQTNKGRLRKRLSTHLPVPDNMDVTVSTDIPVIHPDTQQEVLLSCFNPAAGASVIGPSGDSPKPDDPFSLTLLTQQNLFTTGVLTLAPASEKPLQRTMSTAVLYFITYGKILVTINRATTILETGDHFFVPRGTVYSLRNLRKEEAVISFANLMVDQAECEQAENSA
ncbi:uncharacterized protein LOC143280632 isoform X2 [Babylonia areolata]|uniref:uncharacterized protein LOC143280632 isoform X2 n=1 Tax=Babylonia areolata TaxID=304850 RepID=UPI003FD0446C